jgi:hypothetical protein
MVLRGNWCNIIVQNAHAKLGRKVMTQRSISMRNLNRFTIIFLSTVPYKNSVRRF